MGYVVIVVGLVLQNPELQILFQLDFRLLRLNVKVQEINNFCNNFVFIFSIFFLNPVVNMVANYMHKIENKSLWKEEMYSLELHDININ